MTQYGGFDPGTFQPWSLNIVQKSLGQPGIGYGMQVTPATPSSMNVVVTIDATASDAVCFLPNGAWLRIDANVTLSVPANASGNTRTDAVVAYVDPTGTTAAALYYVTSWATGFTPSGNSLPVAVVSVPNGASGIVASNIVETPLLANAGGGSALQPDAVVGDVSNTYCQPGIFAEYNLVLTSSALSNQTSFSVALTQLQRLVPQGRIGGTQEIGYFAGPKGWYTPRIFGSASGELAVTSVDPIGAVFSTSPAQAGEVVYASFKYYDFGMDLQSLGGTRFVPVDSPYCVYQGEAIPGSLAQSTPLFPTTKSIQLNSGDAVYITLFQGAYAGVLYAVNQASVKYSTIANGTAATTNGTAEYNSSLSPYPLSAGLSPSNPNQANLFELLCNSGTLEFGGVVTGNLPSNHSVVQDGGEVTVNGRTVTLHNTSVDFISSQTIPSGEMLSGFTYTDKSGSLYNTINGQTADKFAGRIPVAAALQYGSNLPLVFGEAAFGIWTPAEAPFYMTPAWFSVGTLKGARNSAGWQLVADAASPFGVALQSTSTLDMLMLNAYATGLDVVASLPNTTGFVVQVTGVTSYHMTVNPTSGYVSTTIATNLPAQYNTIQLGINSNSYLGATVAALDLRFPASTPPQVNATPLSEIWGTNAHVNRVGFAGAVGVSIAAPRTGSVAWQNDNYFWGMGRNLAFDNLSTDVSVTLSFASYSTAAPLFVCGPNQGKALIQAGAWTAMLDLYTASVGLISPTWVSASLNEWSSLTMHTTGTKNAASSSLSLTYFGVNTFEHALHVKDARYWANDGFHPSALGSSLLGFRGQQTPTQYGVGADHLQDRGVTSRKMRPTWAQSIVSTAWSASPTGAIDPYLFANITVEVPSLLHIGVTGMAQASTGQTCWQAIYVDGMNVVGASGSQAQTESGVPGTGTSFYPISIGALAVVGPGAHTVSLYVTGSVQLPNTISRSMQVVAFAL